ncbi:MAG TPA: DNA cytosine methyltransferase [Mucilaginibacter sp.]|jgi:DNA (cytosine-5)-methyltransferase 1|nr:DNA cytosine methyltransferase [Mucilaginibacter sp.]
MKIASFFSGCGGMDLGFKNAGFDVIWANDNAANVWETFEYNFPETQLSKASIKKIAPDDIPQVTGVIGGPPCQSWSNAGSGRGILDQRGILFFDFIKIIKEKQPLFFVAENVEGLLAERNKTSYDLILVNLKAAGYNVTPVVLNGADYGVPQNRKRIFFVGYRGDLDLDFHFPEPQQAKVTVKDAIYDLKDNAIPSLPFNQSNYDNCAVANHEYWRGTYSYIFMSRNRVLSWDAQSYTIQASGRQVSIHPQAPEMVKVAKDVRIFKPGFEHLYRRLSVRECARIQTFPDDFKFIYNSLDAGYKMIGNSVPVNLSNAIAVKIATDLKGVLNPNRCEQNMDLRLLANAPR